MASDAHRIVPATAPLPALPDELWEEIFLRLADVADLARASASCRSFLRVVSGRPFRRRLRSLHAPPVLGFVYVDNSFHSAQPPHRSAPSGRAFASSADFAFSFLPEPRRWNICDARDGLILLRRWNDSCFDELVVYDPLHRRHVHVPGIPDDLVTSDLQHDCRRVVYFLAPTGEDDVQDDKEERSPFLVIGIWQNKIKTVAFVFCSGNAKWRGVTYHSSGFSPHQHELFGSVYGYRRSYAHGCLFWKADLMNFSLVLDIHEMKFSIIDLPPELINDGSDSDQHRPTVMVVDAGEGMLGLLTFDDSTISLFRRAWRNICCVGVEEWQHYRTTSFPKDSDGNDYEYWVSAGAADDAYLLMVAHEFQQSCKQYPSWQYHYHTLELKTLNFERLCVSKRGALSSHLYARFPPLLAPPSI